MNSLSHDGKFFSHDKNIDNKEATQKGPKLQLEMCSN